ncbi:MAG TPA: thioredoxin [Propionicimonas sp.]|nr:thioredoxin [Propionicimonas sp.]
MATVALTNEDFGPTVEKDGIVFVDFWAAWCGPCRMFSPIFEAASEEYPDVVFAKVDTDAQQELAVGLDVQSIPTVMGFRDGYLVFREAGVLNKRQLEGVLQQVRELDMDELRAQVAAQSDAN